MKKTLGILISAAVALSAIAVILLVTGRENKNRERVENGARGVS
ncbi:MAG: hypothetical protein ACQEQV_04400 [Fibrobacterota bacterium]